MDQQTEAPAAVTTEVRLDRLKRVNEALKFAHDATYDALEPEYAAAIMDHIMQAIDQCSGHFIRLQQEAGER